MIQTCIPLPPANTRVTGYGYGVRVRVRGTGTGYGYGVRVRGMMGFRRVRFISSIAVIYRVMQLHSCSVLHLQ